MIAEEHGDGALLLRPQASSSAAPLEVPSAVALDGVAAGVAPGAILEIQGLIVAYGPTVAVSGVSFSIGRGEIFGLLGPNGAGKTSTLSAIEGLVKPRSGTVLLDGLDIRRHATQAKSRMGVQLQATSFQAELTIRQIIRLYAGLSARAAPWATSGRTLRAGARSGSS